MNNRIVYLTCSLILLIFIAILYSRTKQISTETIIPSIQDALAQ
jgi:hypothetical protein